MEQLVLTLVNSSEVSSGSISSTIGTLPRRGQSLDQGLGVAEPDALASAASTLKAKTGGSVHAASMNGASRRSPPHVAAGHVGRGRAAQERQAPARSRRAAAPARAARPPRRPPPAPTSAGRPTSTASAPSASAVSTSPPRRTPPSISTGTRPATASATSARASIVAGTPSSWRPPWLETITPRRARPRSPARRRPGAISPFSRIGSSQPSHQGGEVVPIERGVDEVEHLLGRQRRVRADRRLHRRRASARS